jgi:uncharacterized protein (DUF1501 family)
MLLASRLVAAGVRFVTVVIGGWDTHSNNFNTLRNTLLPRLDESLSALLNTLKEDGRLADTAVMVTGEFGRTPKVNGRAGRDHWARAMCALLAGGAVKPGQVVGASDAKGEGPDGDGFSPDDLAATFYQSLGIDPKREFRTPSGRPIALVRNGQPIEKLF